MFPKQRGWLNDRQNYGVLTVVLHWLIAFIILGLFASGLWIDELSLYDAWYKRAPFYHKSFGVLLFFLVLVRCFVRWRGETVAPAACLSPKERLGAAWGHRLLYAGMLIVPILGYGISTADGRGIAFFSLFTVPALPFSWENQEDVMGELHEIGAFGLIGLAAAHAAMAVYHGRSVLRRMLLVSR